MYERSFGTDWTALSIDEATERAFALGVATALGSPDPDEYERVLNEAGTSYEQSFVELAFQEGKLKASGQRSEVTEETQVWETLVADGPKTTVEEDELPPDSRDGLPSALESLDMLDRPLDEDLDRERLPDFLRK